MSSSSIPKRPSSSKPDAGPFVSKGDVSNEYTEHSTALEAPSELKKKKKKKTEAVADSSSSSRPTADASTATGQNYGTSYSSVYTANTTKAQASSTRGVSDLSDYLPDGQAGYGAGRSSDLHNATDFLYSIGTWHAQGPVEEPWVAPTLHNLQATGENDTEIDLDEAIDMTQYDNLGDH